MMGSSSGDTLEMPVRKLVFADDGAILASSKSISKRAMKEFQEVGKKYGLTFRRQSSW